MARRDWFAALAFVFAIGFPGKHLAAQVVAEVTSIGELCMIESIGCDALKLGRLEPGDCTLPTGQYVDWHQAEVAKGQLVTVTLRPTSATYTDAFATLVPPQGDSSKTPAAAGPGSLEMSYVTSSAGGWSIGASSLSLLSSGGYVVLLECRPDPAPAEPQNCVTQILSCGQSATWSLTSSSCRFASGTTVYAPYQVRGEAGRSISIRMESSAIKPLLAIYDESQLLASDRSPAQSVSTLNYTFPYDGWYFIAATSNTSQTQLGSFTLKITCAIPPCDRPLLVDAPRDLEIRAGDRAALSAQAIGTDPMKFEWINVNDSTTTPGGPNFTTEPLFADAVFRVVVSNECGYHESQDFTVTVKPTRRRPARR